MASKMISKGPYCFAPVRSGTDVLRVIDVVFGQKPVAQVDTALEVGIVGGHVISADLVVDAGPRPAHSGHHVVARLEFRDFRTYCFHSSKAFVTGDKEIIPLRRRAVLSCVDLFIRAVHSYT